MNAAAARMESNTQDVIVNSKLLGALSIPAEQVFTFREGVFGFPEAHGFALVPAERDGFFWLQSVDFEALTFLLLDPFEFVEGYAVELGPHELRDLAPEDASQLVILSIITLPRKPGEDATVNLQGPVALDLARREGRQVVIQDSPYGLRYPVPLNRSEASENEAKP